jgi:hypothetical protein
LVFTRSLDSITDLLCDTLRRVEGRRLRRRRARLGRGCWRSGRIVGGALCAIGRNALANLFRNTVIGAFRIGRDLNRLALYTIFFNPLSNRFCPAKIGRIGVSAAITLLHRQWRRRPLDSPLFTLALNALAHFLGHTIPRL